MKAQVRGVMVCPGHTQGTPVAGCTDGCAPAPAALERGHTQHPQGTLPLWQAERVAEKATRRREEITEHTCRCGSPILRADASGAMPVRLDPAALDYAGYTAAENAGRPVWGVRDNGHGRRTVDDYWPATPDDHLDGVTWHATHRCPQPATDGTSTERNHR